MGVCPLAGNSPILASVIALPTRYNVCLRRSPPALPPVNVIIKGDGDVVQDVTASAGTELEVGSQPPQNDPPRHTEDGRPQSVTLVGTYVGRDI